MIFFIYDFLLNQVEMYILSKFKKFNFIITIITHHFNIIILLDKILFIIILNL